MRNVTDFLEKPEPFILPRALVNALTSEERAVAAELVVTIFRTGGSAIKHPSHGSSGWYKRDLLIYNDKQEWGSLGWYHLKDYQVLKVLGTRKPDYRVMPPVFYEQAKASFLEATEPPSTFARKGDVLMDSFVRSFHSHRHHRA